MWLTVNGENREVDARTTVAGLLEGLGVDPGTVVVERNLTILRREEHGEEHLADGDKVEIIRMVDGG